MSLSTDLPRAAQPTHVRYIVVAALCVAAAVAYIQRNSYGGAEKQIRADLNLTPAQTGGAAGLLFLPYALLQVPAGWLAQRTGPRWTIVSCAAGWSIVLGLSALVSDPYSLIGGRLLVGALQAGLLPSATLIVAAWLPASRRGAASGLLQSAMLIGGALNNNLTGTLISQLGWRGLFLVYAGPGLVWALLFAVWFRNRPADHPGVNAAELAVIGRPPTPEQMEPRVKPATIPSESGIAAVAPTGLQAGRDFAEQNLTAAPADSGRLAPRVADQTRSDWPTVVRRPSTWLILLSLPLWCVCLQQFCRAGATRFVDVWLPTYLQESSYLQERQPIPSSVNTVSLLASPSGVGPLLAASGLTQQHLGTNGANQFASLPQWLGVIGSTLGGLLSDYLLKRTGSRRIARQGLAIVSIVIALALYIFAFTLSDLTWTMFAFCAGFFVFYFSSSCAYAITLDMGGPNLGVVFGLMNMAGNFGAAAFSTLAPLLNHWLGGHWYGDDWSPTLILFAAMHVAAVLFLLPLNPNGVIGERAPPPEPKE